jgi:RNA polymerase sigma-70 factor (ECF subfamily)
MPTERFEDDKAIIEGCAARDIAAWEAFTKKYSRLMRISIEKRLRRCGFETTSHDVDDILQDALSSMWRSDKMASLDNISSLPCWISMLAQNAAVSHLRKARRGVRYEILPHTDTGDEVDLISSLFAGGSVPADELSRQELSKKIDQSIEDLPSVEKLVIKLHLLHGKKYHEIAKMTRMPKNTVSSHVRRGKERLRAALKCFLTFFATICPFLASYIVGGQK